ncbi:hypothetical protein GW17_00052004 [Ensete ventricosum]|nr:hypothetical protein GW17_00052004 [Ensete ventricosum]
MRHSSLSASNGTAEARQDRPEKVPPNRRSQAVGPPTACEALHLLPSMPASAEERLEGRWRPGIQAAAAAAAPFVAQIQLVLRRGDSRLLGVHKENENRQWVMVQRVYVASDGPSIAQ